MYNQKQTSIDGMSINIASLCDDSRDTAANTTANTNNTTVTNSSESPSEKSKNSTVQGFNFDLIQLP
jgi:hypothetical protein